MDGLVAMKEPEGKRHLWLSCFINDGGPALWQCRDCGEVSYYDIPDAVGCKPKEENEKPPE